MQLAIALLTAANLAAVPITDSNPWNPQNWDTSYSIEAEGASHSIGWALNSQNQVELIEYTGDWAVGEYLPGKAGNTTGSSRTCISESEGEITTTIKWIGDGPPPEEILVEIDARSWYKISGVGGSGHANNGLGDPEVALPRGAGYESEGEKYRMVQIDDLTGEGEVTVGLSAKAVITGTSVNCEVSCSVPTIQIADRAAGIELFSVPNYGRELSAPNGPYVQKLNVNDDPTDVVLDVVLKENANQDLYYATPASLDSMLFGNWDMGSVAINLSHPADPIHSELIRYFTYSEYENMLDNGAEAELMEINADDDLQNPRYGKTMLYIHAPMEGPYQTDDFRVYGGWIRVSAEAELNPSESFTVSSINTVAHTHSTSFTWGVGLDIGFKIKELFTAAVKPSAAWTEGDQATISTSLSQAMQVTNNSEQPLVYWLERQGFHRQREGYASHFTDNGYQGEVFWANTYYESGTSDEAELYDFTTRWSFREP